MDAKPQRSARRFRTHYAIAAIVPALIVVLSITGFVSAQKPVTVVVDGRALHMKTQADDVASLLAEAGVEVGRGDVVVPSRSSRIRAGSEVIVRHAVPVDLELGGQTVRVKVVGETVADALIAAGIDPAANPAVTPSLDAPLRSGLTISAPDTFVRLERESVTLPVTTHTRPDSSLPKGKQRVVSQGEAGRVMRVYRVVVTNGIEGPRALTAEQVVAQQKPRVIAVGTGRSAARAATVAAPRAAARPPKGGRKLEVVATGYSAQQADLDDRTATGALARRGVIAVDPDVIPLGTRVYVPGYGYAVAADTGGSIQGNRIDLCFGTVAEALQWGRRSVTIVILD